MVLVIEIILFIAGIGALLHGKLKFGEGNVVRGPAARALGALAMVPLPMAVVFGIWIGTRARDAGTQLNTVAITVAELVYILLCLGVIAGSVTLLARMRKSYRKRVKAVEAEEDRAREPGRRARRAEPTETPKPPPTGLIVGGAYASVLGVGLVLGFIGVSQAGGRKSAPPPAGGRDVSQNPAPAGPPPVDDGIDFRVPPAPAPVAIAPLQLDEPTDIDIPAPVARVAVGGGGRFLVLDLPTANTVAIFDCSEARVRHELKFDETVHLAAGMTKLLVLVPRTGQLHRYDLMTGTREATQPFAAERVFGFAMGSASDGPALLMYEDSGRFIDVEKLATVHTFSGTSRRDFANWCNYKPSCWASADGRVFGLTRTREISPTGIVGLVLTEDRLTSHYLHSHAYFVCPSPDGKYLFASGCGALTAETRTTPDVIESRASSHHEQARFLVPAVHGPYYLDIATRPKQPAKVTVYRYGRAAPLGGVEVAGLPPSSETRRALTTDRTVFFVPQAKLLVAIPESGAVLRLFPFDPDNPPAK